MNRPLKFRFLEYPILYGIVVFLVLLIATQFLTYERYQMLKKTDEQETILKANWIENEFQKVLNQSFSATQTLAFIVKNYGVPENFDSIAHLLLETNKNIDALELVDSLGVITNVYPIESNNIQGFNILNDTIGRKGALITMQRKEYFVTGPIKLKQGGDGLVSRIPIFKGNKFQGFSAAVIKLPKLLQAIQISKNSEAKYAYQLAKVNADKTEEIFFSTNSFSEKNAYSKTISMTKGEWKLYVFSKKKEIIETVSIFSILGLLLSCIGGIFVWHLLRQPSRLDQLVKEKSAMLIESEEKYRLLIENATDGIFLLDQNANFLDVNIQLISMFKASKEYFIGKNVLDFIDPEDILNTPLKFDELKEGQTISSVRKLIRKDNTKFLAETRVKMLPNHLFQGILQDITEKEKATAQIKESEQKYRELTERITDAFVAFDLDWNFSYISAKAMEFIPPNVSKLLGKNFWGIFPKIIGKNLHANFLSALETQSNIKGIHHSQRLDKWIEYRIYPSSTGVSVYFSDITAVEKAKEEVLYTKAKMESAIRIGKIGYWSWDLVDNSLEWSDRMYTIFDMDKDTPLNFESATKCIHPEDRQMHEDLIANRIEHKDNTPFSFRVLHKDNSIHHVLVELEILYNDDEEINKLHGTAVDITERVKATEQIKESEQKYRELTERVTDALVAYDKNWNLSYINTVAQKIFGYEGVSVLGMNILELLPGVENNDSYELLKNSMITQEYTYYTTFYEPFNKWFENHVYPSPEGVSIHFRDVTERIVSQNKMADLQAKMVSAIRIGKIGYWSWDMIEDTMEWSDRMYEIYDFDPQNPLNYESATNCIHPDDRKKHDELIKLKIQNKNDSPVNYRVLHKDNSVHYVSVDIEMVENDKGETIKLQGTVVDVTEKIKDQLNLKESQEKFYKSFHSNLTGKVIVDEERTILEANETIAILLETTRENLIGKKLIDADVLDYNLHKQSENRLIVWEKLLKQGFLRDEEITYTLKSGKQIPALLSIEPLELENKTHYLVSAIDNTKRKEAEEELVKSEARFRKLASTTPVGIFQSDASGACTYVNAEWLKYTGMEFDEAMGNGWMNSTYTPDRKRVSKEWKQTIAERKIFKSKFRLKHKNGKIITLSVKAIPLYGIDNEFVGFIGMASDISNLILAEKRLEAQNIELSKTNAELDRFVYSASHELRAPLASVLGLINIILSEEKEPDLVFKLQMMEQSVKRLDSFIKDIVQYSQNRHLEIASEKINFHSLVQDSLESFWYLENRSQINIHVTIYDEIEFYSDKKRISIILNNLISNAIKYHNVTGANPIINITITTSRDQAVIEIKDNGLGIPKEHLKSIFKMFYRVSSKIMGTGIGLFVVKEIVEKIDGKITVTSEENKGTTFTVILPNQMK